MSDRGPEPRLTARQREWLGHLRACERSGETIKDYAARHGLSVQSLYQAAKRLRQRGVCEPRARREPPPGRPFVKVERPGRSREAGVAWRVRLPNGVVFEASPGLGHEALLALVERLAAR